jgi:transposase, IS5 family
MRNILLSPQSNLGHTYIGDIKINLNSRDDIPRILLGLQSVYEDKKARQDIERVLASMLSDKQINIGRQGMDMWKVFVLGIMRLNLNCDYDRLQELANEHRTLRQMLGHCFLDDDKRYALQTIKDNVGLLTEEALGQLNVIMINYGHRLLNATDNPLLARCDSFVVERNVHFPTDISLLFDALCKAINLTAQACGRLNLSDWRQSDYNIRQLKKAFRKSQQSKKGKRKDHITKTHQAYLNQAQLYLNTLNRTLKKLDKFSRSFIQPYIDHSARQIQQTYERVIEHKTIESSQKVYSIFEPDTEWVNKGKAGNKIELGIKVAIMEDQHQFILHHRVMRQEQDAYITVDIIKDTQINFPQLQGCSFDKGFYSAVNLAEAKKLIDKVVMPKKGKLNQLENLQENDSEFVKTRHQHSAVESAINCLEQHGLDRCPDKGGEGFDCYVTLAVLSRNVQRIGEIVQKKRRKQEVRKKRKLSKAA